MWYQLKVACPRAGIAIGSFAMLSKTNFTFCVAIELLKSWVIVILGGVTFRNTHFNHNITSGVFCTLSWIYYHLQIKREWLKHRKGTRFYHPLNHAFLPVKNIYHRGDKTVLKFIGQINVCGENVMTLSCKRITSNKDYMDRWQKQHWTVAIRVGWEIEQGSDYTERGRVGVRSPNEWP